MSSWTSTEGCTLKVLCWRCVCVLYPLLFLLARPSPVESAKTRCGWELVADLEFVCGDRGFYRGKAGGLRGAVRSRGKGIVENCCVRGCDLQHLEKYCATTPKRGRRNTPLPLEQTLELRRYQKMALTNFHEEAFASKLKERAQYLQTLRDLRSHRSNQRNSNS
ncbi:insulin-like growth factor 3 [Denticeps clupeoides]|uniref:insulin-like growth factor 3 n=1 Tax=Denticeps clupeoides TaxID=299321 RepID=UPI0010A46095|nr:insulin-like growth factor I [Denticeps clupeoides]